MTLARHLLAALLVAACNNSHPAESKTTTPAASTTTSAATRVTDTFATPAGSVMLTPIHHATFLLRVGGKAIYFDPVVEGASYDGLPKADYVLVTDIHPDHMDPKGVAAVKKDDTVIVAPPAVNEKMPASTVLKNGETHDFGLFKVEAVPMYNLTRGPNPGQLFHDKGRGNGYVLTFAGAAPSATVTRLYVSGDTECTPEMKALQNIDVAFVCMNLPYTMPPSEAAACINAFKPKIVFPFHYRGSNLDELSAAVKPESHVEIRKREWY